MPVQGMLLNRALRRPGGADKTVANGYFGYAWALVREYAHQVRKERKPGDRVDFTETLYWNAGVKTNAKGEAKVDFGLNDSVTTFRVLADGFASSGALGAGSTGVKSVQPFYAEAKLPLEVTGGDRILVPVSLVNATEEKLLDPSITVNLKGDFKLAPLQRGLAADSPISAGQRVRMIQP